MGQANSSPAAGGPHREERTADATKQTAQTSASATPATAAQATAAAHAPTAAKTAGAKKKSRAPASVAQPAATDVEEEKQQSSSSSGSRDELEGGGAAALAAGVAKALKLGALGLEHAPPPLLDEAWRLMTEHLPKWAEKLPLPGAKLLAAAMLKCVDIIDAAASKQAWMNEFKACLISIDYELLRASSCFVDCQFYFEQLADQLASGQSLLNKVTERPTWFAWLTNCDDQQAMQELMDGCEKIKQKALFRMITEMKGAIRTDMEKSKEDSERRSKQIVKNLWRLKEVDRLKGRLQPQNFSLVIDKEINYFTEGTRGPILAAVKKWLGISDSSQSCSSGSGAGGGNSSMSPASSPSAFVPSSSRLFWIEGESGMGKSCLSAKLCELHAADLIGVHFCCYNDPERRDSRRVVKSLAFQMAQHIPTYGAALIDLIPCIFGVDTQVGNKSTKILWQQLILGPIAAVRTQLEAERKGSAASGRKFLLIDALDELASGSDDGDNELLELLASSAVKTDLPPWIGIIVTSRPEPTIHLRLQRQYTPVTIARDDAENQTDLRLFFEHRIAASHASETDSALIDLLRKKSEGSFLLGRMMMEVHGLLLSAGGVKCAPRYEDVKGWPDGLVEFYLSRLDYARSTIHTGASEGARMIPHKGRQVEAHFVKLLDAVAFVLAAAEPLTLECVADMLKLSSHLIVFRLFQLLKPLLSITPPATESLASTAVPSPHSKVSLCHESLRKWFFEEAKAADDIYSIDSQETHRDMAAACWKQLLEKGAEPLSGAGVTSSSSSPSSSSPVPPTLSLPALRVDDLLAETAQAPAKHELEIHRVACKFCKHSPVIGPCFWVRHVSAAEGFFICADCKSPERVGHADVTKLIAREHESAVEPPMLTPSFLTYAVLHGPTHAIASADAVAASSFLCHPQYLHMRAIAGRPMQLNSEFMEAVNIAKNQAAQLAAALSKKKEKQKHEEWCWSLPLPHSSLLLQFRRLVIKHGARWASTPELIYQYAASFPDSTPVSALGRLCLFWLSGWSHHSHAIATWTNKPDQLSDMVGKVVLPGNPSGLSAHPMKCRFAVGDTKGVSVWDLHTQSSIMHMKQPSDDGCKVCYSPKGEFIAAGSFGQVRVYSAEDGSLRWQLPVRQGAVLSLAFNRDAALLAAAAEDRVVTVWEMKSGKEINAKIGERKNEEAAAPETSVQVVFAELKESPLTSTSASALAPSASGTSSRLVYLVKGGSVVIADPMKGEELTVFGSDIQLLALHPRQPLLATWDRIKGLQVWDLEQHKPEPDDCFQSVPSLLASALEWSECNWLAMACSDGRIHVWDTKNGALLHVYTPVTTATKFNQITFSAGSSSAGSSSAGSTWMLARGYLNVSVWDTTPLKNDAASPPPNPAEATFVSVPQEMYWMRLSADRSRLVTAPPLRVWDASPEAVRSSSGPIQTWPEDLAIDGGVALSPNGSQVCGGVGSIAKVWDVSPGKEERTLQFPGDHAAGKVASVDWSDDGQLIAVAKETILCVFRADDGELLHTLLHAQPPFEQPFYMVRFKHHVPGAAPGIAIATGKQDQRGCVSVWNLPPLEDAGSIAGLVLSQLRRRCCRRRICVPSLEAVIWREALAAPCLEWSPDNSSLLVIVSHSRSALGPGPSAGGEDERMSPWPVVRVLNVSKISQRGDGMTATSAQHAEVGTDSAVSPPSSSAAVALSTRLKKACKHPTAACWSPTGTQIAVGGADGWLHLIDVQSDRKFAPIGRQASITKVAFGPEGERSLFSCSRADGLVRKVMLPEESSTPSSDSSSSTEAPISFDREFAIDEAGYQIIKFDK